MMEPKVFTRNFYDPKTRFTQIGRGGRGGKAAGLLEMADAIEREFEGAFEQTSVEIPRFCVVATDVFDAFIAHNDIDIARFEDMADERIAHEVQKCEVPPAILGDLRALSNEVKSPLAVRSSSVLEDAMFRPFAGVYATKMIPNDAPSPDERFRKLVEAIKFVYASTFFSEARAYRKAIGVPEGEEKMAVLLQEIVGERRGNRFYPTLSAVARSYNFYPYGGVRPEDGVVELALGLGKTIVDGEVNWHYCPKWPKSPPPFNDLGDMMKNTQTRFWAVGMGKPPVYDPVRETEYLVRGDLAEADYDNTLKFLCSTYDPSRDRMVPGDSVRGPRILTFAPLLDLGCAPLVEAVDRLMRLCEEKMKTRVEVELAMVLDRERALPARLGFLQVRPMVVDDTFVEVAPEELMGDDVVASSDRALGNGTRSDIQDVVYLRPEAFDPSKTPQIAQEVAEIDARLREEGRPCLLIGFGRWGTSDPWCGVPVNWSQISSAAVIVEATRPGMTPELSQGSHFFHNVTSFKVLYLSVPHGSDSKIDWAWLDGCPEFSSTKLVRHVRLEQPLAVRVDGRSQRGLVLRHGL